MTDQSRRVPSWLVDVPFTHRGLHGSSVPENSLPAFAAAADAGWGIELDVQLTADGDVVVFHDRTLERLVGRLGHTWELPTDELRGLRLAGSDHHIPLLHEVLDIVGDRVALMIELKTFDQQVGPLERAVTAVLDRHTGPFCVSSFNPVTVRWFRDHRPAWIRGQASGLLHGVPMPPWLRTLLRRMAWNRSNRPDFVAYELAALPHPAVDRARRRGVAVLAWTVDSVQALEVARSLADNVIFESITATELASMFIGRRGPPGTP